MLEDLIHENRGFIVFMFTTLIVIVLTTLIIFTDISANIKLIISWVDIVIFISGYGYLTVTIIRDQISQLDIPSEDMKLYIIVFCLMVGIFLFASFGFSGFTVPIFV